jgi:hypothetical protein
VLTLGDEIKELDLRKKELLDLEKQTHRESQKLLSMVMEREEHLEKRERSLLEREKAVREKEKKLDEYKERLLLMTKNLKEKAQQKKASKTNESLSKSTSEI